MDPSRIRGGAAAETLSDDELVARVQARGLGYRHAFDVLAARHRGWLLARCQRMLRCPADAEDVVQETLAAALLALPRFEGRSAFRTWVTVIAENRCRSLLGRRPPTVSLDALEADACLDWIADREDGFEQLLDRDEVAHRLAGLAPSAREVVELRFVVDLELAEISERLNIGLSATKMRLYRALDQLRAAETAPLAA